MDSTQTIQADQVMKDIRPVIQQFEDEMSAHVRSLRDIEGKGLSDIERVYEDSVVFITGGTGFLGKQLIEKLLRACPGIKKMYVLSRSKKGKDPQQRLDSMVTEPVFDELRSRCPDFRSRLYALEGDVSLPRLGIKQEVWKALTKEINFIFHVAATVRFNEPLRVAVHTNVRGTSEIVSLARECKSLRCLVHVSTAFAHCNRFEIHEKFYDSPMSPQTLLDLVDDLKDEKLNAITADLIKDWPNTYTYTKAVAEEVIRTMCKGLPACIVRPAIIVAAYHEPSPGWLDPSAVYGATGTILACHLGILRVALVDPNQETAHVPVDFVNNLTIAASWDTIQRHSNGEDDIKIYTLSRERKPHTWMELSEIRPYLLDFMSPSAVFYEKVIATPNIHIYRIATFFLHWIPSLIMDPLLALAGSKMRIAPIHKKLEESAKHLKFFSCNSWILDDENTLELYEKMTKIDSNIFKFNMYDINALQSIKLWCLGVRKYILKDELKCTAKDRRKISFLLFLQKFDTFLIFLYALTIFTLLFSFFNALIHCFQRVQCFLL